jgi:hypothetical protein
MSSAVWETVTVNMLNIVLLALTVQSLLKAEVEVREPWWSQPESVAPMTSQDGLEADSSTNVSHYVTVSTKLNKRQRNYSFMLILILDNVSSLT